MHTVKTLTLTSKGRHAVIFFFSGWPGSLRLSPTLNFLAVRLASPTELSPLRFNTHTCKKNAGKLFKLETALAPTVSLHIPKTSSYLTSASPKNYKHYILPTPPSWPSPSSSNTSFPHTLSFYFFAPFFFFQADMPISIIMHVICTVPTTSDAYARVLDLYAQCARGVASYFPHTLAKTRLLWAKRALNSPAWAQWSFQLTCLR